MCGRGPGPALDNPRWLPEEIQPKHESASGPVRIERAAEQRRARPLGDGEDTSGRARVSRATAPGDISLPCLRSRTTRRRSRRLSRWKLPAGLRWSL
jgi:hypothetical protein